MPRWMVSPQEKSSWQYPVIDKDLTSPPGSPSEGDRYIVGPSATGDWFGHVNDIAYWDGSSWMFIAVTEGMVVYVKDEDRLYRFITSWMDFGVFLQDVEVENLYVNDEIIKLGSTLGISSAEGIWMYTGEGEEINFICGGIFRWQDRDSPSFLPRMELDSEFGNLWIDGNFWACGDLYINWDNTNVDAVLYFGKPTSGYETLKWDITDGRFEFSDPLFINGDLYLANNKKIHIPSFALSQIEWELWASGQEFYIGIKSGWVAKIDMMMKNLEFKGNMWAHRNVAVNKGASNYDATILFYKPIAGYETLKWSKTINRFEFTDDLFVDGDFITDGVNGRGTVVKDKTTGVRYRIIVDNGSVACEAA